MRCSKRGFTVQVRGLRLIGVAECIFIGKVVFIFFVVSVNLVLAGPLVFVFPLLGGTFFLVPRFVLPTVCDERSIGLGVPSLWVFPRFGVFPTPVARLIFETKIERFFWRDFPGEEFREKHYCPYNFVPINWLWNGFIFPN